MLIPTLGNGTLFHIHRNKDRWLTEMERRKAFGLLVALFTVITIGVIAWILQ